MLEYRGTSIPRACGCSWASLHAEVLPFSTKPTEAINFLKKKTNVPTEAWTDLWQQEHSASFTVAGAMTDGLDADPDEVRGARIAHRVESEV